MSAPGRDDGPRYPLAALVAAAGMTERQLSEAAGLSGTTLKKAREWGLTLTAADRYACRLGLHPLEVWPDFALYDVECASSDCDVRFVPRDLSGQQRYCSARCRQREKARRYRATERGAESARRIRRRYYWSDARIREYEARMKARPQARAAEAARRRELRALERKARENAK